MNALRARHLENALLHFEDSRSIAAKVGLPIDIFLRRYFHANKHLKLPDRQFLSEHMYDLIRWRGLLDQVGGTPYRWHNRMRTYFVSDRWRKYTEKRDIPDAAKASFPAVLFERLKISFGGDLKTVKDICNISNEKAVYFLRCNIFRQDRDSMYKQLLSKNVLVEKTRHSDIGLILNDAKDKAKVLDMAELKQGFFEFQDESNQLVAAEITPKSGDKVMDYCAGSGGKTLAFAPKMMNTGNVFLHDLRDTMLKKAKLRMRNAGIRNYVLTPPAHPRLSQIVGKCDWVLVDVPSSATGCYRKSPEKKWEYTDDKLFAYIAQQRGIFHDALVYLAPKGKMVYSTNSILEEENAAQVAYFCEKYGLVLSKEPRHALPQSRGLDGFFVAVMERG